MKKKQLILCIILYMLMSIMVNIIHPITTSFVEELNLPVAYFGILFSFMSLGQVVGSIFWGFVSDKIGRKWPIILGIIGYGLGQFGFGFIHVSPLLILVFRFFAGFFIAGPNTIFISLVLDNYQEQNNRTKILSIFSGSNLLGAALGYEIGGALYEYASLTYAQLFIFQIIFAFFISFALLFVLTNTFKKSESKYDLKYLFKSTSFISILFFIGLFIMTIGTIIINKYFDVFAIQSGTFTEASLGHYILISGIVGCVANFLLIPFIKKLSSKTSKVLLVLFTLLIGVLCLITFNVGSLSVTLYTTHMTYFVLKACITPLEQTHIASFAKKEDYGKIMGARQSVLSSGNVIGPLIGSSIYTAGNVLIMNISAIAMMVGCLFFLLTFIIQKKKVS